MPSSRLIYFAGKSFDVKKKKMLASYFLFLKRILRNLWILESNTCIGTCMLLFSTMSYKL